MEEQLEQYSNLKALSKTSIVKEALAEYFNRKESAIRPFDLGNDLFGTHGSGRKDTSVNYKSKIKRKLNEKYSR